MKTILCLLLVLGALLPLRADMPNPLDSILAFPFNYRAKLHLDGQFQKGDYVISYSRDDRGTIQAFSIEAVVTHFHFQISPVFAGQRRLMPDGQAHIRSDYTGGADVQQVAIDQAGNTSPAQALPLSEVPQIGVLPVSVSGRQFVGRDTLGGEVCRHYRIPGFPTTDIWVDDGDGHVVATTQAGVYYTWIGFTSN